MHFHSLPDVIRPDVEERIASKNFWPIYRYLRRAIDARQNKRFVLAWKPTRNPTEHSDGAKEVPEPTTTELKDAEEGPRGKPQSKTLHEEVWVQLEDPEDVEDLEDIEDVDESTYQMFFDSKSVTDSATRSRFRIIDTDFKTASLCLERLPSSPTIEVQANTYTLWRQLQALWTLQIRPHPLHRPLLRLIEKNEFARWPRFFPRRVSNWHILTDNTRPGNEDQRRFVNIALNTPDFAFLEGPPGSGKTTAICELILQLVNEGKRVLLCASTHVAVDNVLERLMYRDEVVAVRIGDRSNVSKEARRFQLEERRSTEKENLLNFLIKMKERAPSQELLLEALQREDGEDNIVNLILDSANLVCGTTIGILQYPHIRDDRSTEPLFDALIVDEASKTTFPEFLVPALLARRWILSGDPRQLSPYVDQAEVASNLEPVLTQQGAQVCLDCFEAMKRRTPFILVDPPSEVLELYRSQADRLGLVVHQVENGTKKPKDALMLYGADLIVGDLDAIKGIERCLPVGSRVAYGDIDLPSLERMNSFRSAHSDYGFGGFDSKPAERWAYETAWRLDRIHQLRKYPQQIEGLEKDIVDLRPAWANKEKAIDIEEATKLVRRIALPSILELLQEGITRDATQEAGCALTDGLTTVVLLKRRVLIPYQHRMHPDISRFPREHFYASEGLQDPPNMENEREWGYRRYAKRAIWIEVDGSDYRNSNIDEVEVLLRELKSFTRWAKGNPKSRFDGKSEYWEVAVLTPYRHQENELRRRLRRLYRSMAYKTFHDKSAGVIVKLCTVDRFQGQEADVVFISLVRSHRRPGFMDVPNRLNVAITRPRFQLVLVGKRRFFKAQKASALLRSLAEELPSTVDFRGGGR